MKWYIYPSLVVSSLILTWLSLWIPAAVYTIEDLNSVAFGLPLKFLIEDQSGRDPPLPYKMSTCGPLECPTQIIWPSLFLNLMLIFLTQLLMIRGFRLIKSKISLRVAKIAVGSFDGVFGAWKGRLDIKNSGKWVRKLRVKMSLRKKSR